MRKLLLPILVFALVLSSCTDDLTSLNENPKAPSEVPEQTLFTNAQVNFGTWVSDMNVNSNVFKFYSQYWAATDYPSTSQYVVTTRQIPTNLWEILYRDVLKDLDESAKRVEANQFTPDAVKQNQLAMIDVLNVLTYYELVSMFGNIPYSEALDEENTQASFDDAQTVYTDLMSRLNTAISNFDASADGFDSSADIYYQGDIATWIKFANSLKMRMAITIADFDAATAQTAIEAASPNAFQSNADNTIIPFTSTPPNTNPIWEAVVQSGRDDFVPANTLIDRMNNFNDPRRAVHFTQYEGNYVGGTYGEGNDYANYSHFTGPTVTIDNKGLIMGYAEAEFIRAEANERGWLTGNSAQAAIHYQNAIQADMEYWDVAGGDITTYMGQASVAYPVAGSEQQKMDAIATQKWLGLYMQGLQAWTEWRRLDAPTLNGIASLGYTEANIPVRLTYPIDEQNLNQANYQAAVSAMGGDNLGLKLFWDVN